jgi:hypothetical protein
MRRRRFLVAAAGLAALAGCAGRRDEPAATTPTSTPTPTPVRTAIGDVELPVPVSEFRSPLPADAIPAITDPAFGRDWSELPVVDRFEDRPRLQPESPVVGVERAGEARAYPLAVLNWHEVVNDALGGPLLVTYCPLCGSAVVAERTVAGEPAVFGVSGKLWRGDLVLYDRPTGSLWSQILAAAIRGPRTGERFTLVPSSLTSWGAWRETHPDTRVLLPPPVSGSVDGYEALTDYGRSKYGHEKREQLIGYDDGGDGFGARTFVVGVTDGDAAKAYPYAAARERPINDRVGDRPVVVAVAPGNTLVAYDRRVDGRTLEFAADGDRHLAAGGSRWRRATGEAVDGPFAGRHLENAVERSPMFWDAWRDFHPDTTVYGRG